MTGTRTRGFEKKSEDHPNYCIIEIDQNTENSLGELRRAEKTCSNSREELFVNAGVKNSKRSYNNNNNNNNNNCICSDFHIFFVYCC